MERPLQITFRGMDTSPALDALIRERVRRLEVLYPRLTGCRVVVEVLRRGSESAKVPLAISVEADVPGMEPILGKDQAKRRAAKEDHTAAVTSRSNWAKDSNTLRVRRPIEVVVLNCWVTETNDTPWESNSSTSLAKSASDLVSRSTL